MAVRAKFLQSYKGEQKHKSIMGSPYGMLYLIRVTEVLGSSSTRTQDDILSNGAELFIYLPWSICERYHPGRDVLNSEKTLVLRMGLGGIYELVGGERN